MADDSFSANPDVYDQLIPTVQKILNSINELGGANDNNVQSLPAGSNNQQQQLGGDKVLEVNSHNKVVK
jgi:hypothetical protein